MTKPKIVNGSCLNPLMRLENRVAEYKRHHEESSVNCNKIQEAHNKSNLELKTLLERKSKISDSKVKKKRSTNGTSINRKKAKINVDKVQTKQFFDDFLEATPNVSLNVHSSDIPDIDLDNFDMLKDPNFSMSINEQELDGVLNNCCPQPTISNDLFINQISSDMTYSYKSSTHPKSEPVLSNLNVNNNNFKLEDNIQPPLFPPPEIPNNSRLPSNNINADFSSSLNYIAPNVNSINTYANNNNIVPATSHHPVKTEDMKYNSNMYSVNVPLNNNNNPLTNQNPASYSYHYNNLNSLNSELPNNNNSNNNSQSYFYHYINYPPAANYSELPSNSASGFQLPTMSSGWYNNPPTQIVKQPNCKPLQSPQLSQHQQQQQYAGIPSTTASNYHNNSFSHYQINPLQCQQMFNNIYETPPFPSNNNSNQNYNLITQQPNLTSYNMIPDQNSYYYVDYPSVPNHRNPSTNSNSNNNNNNNNNNNLNMIGQNDSQFINNHNNTNICRNVVYQSHCI